jgi:myosin-crossreactive antigen
MIKRSAPLICIPAGLFVYNRYDQRKPDHELPQGTKQVVVVGAGITGLVSSYYLVRDPNTQVTLIEKNNVCPA